MHISYNKEKNPAAIEMFDLTLHFVPSIHIFPLRVFNNNRRSFTILNLCHYLG